MSKIKKNAVVVPKPNDNWVITTEMQINGRTVTPGTELKISGMRGRYRFIKHIDTGSTVWVDVWGGPKGSEQWRSCRPEKIRTVHRINQTTANLAKEFKSKRKIQLESAKG